MTRILLPHWNTPRLHVTNSQFSETKELTEIFNACVYLNKWDPTFEVVTEEEIGLLIKQSLDATLATPLFHMQTIKYGQETVGYFHVRYGVPQPNIIWLSMLVIHPDYQGKKFGQEIIEEMTQQIIQLKAYDSIWLEVYLKNWPALRFWIQQGFTNIIEYDGAKRHADNEHALLVLKKHW